MAKTFKDYLQEAIVASKYHCKDCGDTMHKPTTDCSHNSHDEKGKHWIDDNGNGIHDLDESDNLNIDDPDDEENPLAGDNDLRNLYSRKEKANLKKKYDAMMAREKNKKNRSTNESEDRIMFKGKEIDTDTIEYDMQDISDMIFVTDIGVKYTDGTEVDGADMEELEELPAYVDWVYQDYMDGQADKADMYRDAQRHGDLESTMEDQIERGMGALDKFRELYRKSIGTDDDAVVLKELIEVINDDALFADEFTELRAFTNPSQFDDSEVVTANAIPGNTADEKIMSLVKAIDDDSWVESFAEMLMKDFNMDENAELDRIKELAGASIDETYDDDDDFYKAYGEMWYNEDDIVDEAEYQGRKVKLGKPMTGDVKKFKVYVKDPKTGNVKKVNFGHGGSSVKGKSMRIRKNNPGARKSFRARHNCDNPGPRTKARYWSCRKW